MRSLKWGGGGGEYKCIRIVLLVYQHNQTHCEYHYQLLFRHFRCDAARDISYIDYSVGLRIIRIIYSMAFLGKMNWMRSETLTGL